ncbi:MAG: metal-dependent transcriptional regulator [candidate division Zixibacteria bacterium]|nr:metal-dependent transcriptional regulator [candidate division Zixibacteria bacterium]
MYTKAIEDYLKAVFSLQRENQIVTTKLIAKKLNVSPPSVTEMVKNLVQKKLLLYKPYKGVKLTSRGRKEALRIIRAHRLIESFLVEVLDVPWETVHQEAEKWEHVISEDILDRIEKKLNYPANDPHGAQIPSREGGFEDQKLRTLCSLKAGQAGIVREVNDTDPELLEYLTEIDLKPGVKFSVKDISASGGFMRIKLNNEDRFIGLKASEKIFVMII